ncbi:Hsp70 family protein [Mycobacterium sp. 1081908.1]|uniref:Hsp70 family protein n=1 Tax=Mycobacterium sp. 1081908.1 TaxID=1834066 RepID=UPI00080236C7|nr:Hsp70 family protein [Mycobacterium sp. 1081908.1]OBK43173.1 molecular chaperone [Mycobacterium sp. 1081908.1]
MSEALGLSIGAANLVAVRSGRAPVVRSSVLTLFENRPTEIGLPEENPNLTESGLVLRGFVERVGDRAPLVAADGTKYQGEVLTVEAIEAMARTVGYGTPVTVAVPAYWSEAQTTALRDEFFAQPDLNRGGVAPALISDATAALATLRAHPGFPAGVVAVCDFGASGTSVTLINAGSTLAQIGPSVRYTDFSGDAIDQLILDYVRSGGSDATSTDLAGTARIGAQARQLAECRRAKEQLSGAAASGGEVRLSRAELEQLISQPLDGFVSTVEDTLQRNGIQLSGLAAVAAVGGGASIPLIAARLSERLRVPIHTAPHPALAAAVGASVLGQQQAAAGLATAASPVVENPTELVETAKVVDGGPALAWSADADDSAEPVPYVGPDMTGEYGREPTTSGEADSGRLAAATGTLPWYKRTALVLSVVGAAAAVLVAVVLALTLGHPKTNPTNNTPPTEPAPPQTSQTETITEPNGTTTVTVLPPPPAPPSSSTTQPPPSTTTSSPPPTTTTAAPTTTSAQPTTSQATTTAAPTTTRQRPLPLPLPQPPFGR